MKIVNLPVKEIKSHSEMMDKIINLFEEYEITVAEALGYMEIIKSELMEQIYED